MKHLKAIILGCVALVCATLMTLYFTGVIFARDSGIPVITASERFTITPQQEPELKHSFTDGIFDFWHFHMGYVRNVPITWSYTRRFVQGQPQTTWTFTTEEIRTESISESSSHARTQTSQLARNESSTRTIQHSHTVEMNVGVNIEWFSTGLKLSDTLMRSNAMTVGNTTTLGNSISITDTESKVRSFAERSQQTTQFTLTNADRSGYYRYTMFGTIDVFLIIARSTITGEFIYEFDSFTRENTFFSLEFCPHNEFTNRSATDMMVFCESMLDNLPTPRFFGGQGNLVKNLALETDTNIGQVSIPYYIEKAVFVGDERMFEMNILIEPRNRDINFVLKNMMFIAPIGRHGITYCAANISNEHTLTINVVGDNKIVGGTGLDGQNITVAHSRISVSSNRRVSFNNLNNSAVFAGIAGNGVDIGNRNLIVEGSGNLDVRGGQGGLGGLVSMPSTAAPNGAPNFAVGTRYFNNMRYHGGRGGMGIVTSGDVSVSFKNAIGMISVRGGDGGRGGDGVEYRGRWGSPSWNAPVALFHGTNGGAGGNAFGGNPFLIQPLLRPININGGQGGAGGSGMAQNVLVVRQSMFIVEWISVTTSNGQNGASGVQGNLRIPLSNYD